MSLKQIKCAGILWLLGFQYLITSVSARDDGLKVPVSILSNFLIYKGAAIRETNFTVWGASPVMDDDGKTHLFAARWPEANVNPAWRKSSEIAHYEANSPVGLANGMRLHRTILKSNGLETPTPSFT